MKYNVNPKPKISDSKSLVPGDTFMYDGKVYLFIKQNDSRDYPEESYRAISLANGSYASFSMDTIIKKVVPKYTIEFIEEL